MSKHSNHIETRPQKIIVIGAGPVGLWTAIQIKAQNPQAQITMLEKYVEYKRKHVVRVSEESLKSFIKDSRNQLDTPIQRIEVIKLVNKIKSKSRKVKGLMGTTYNISTADLEEVLQATAKAIDISIQTNVNVESLEQIQNHKEYKDADIIIGADGSHSIVRKSLFGQKQSAGVSSQAHDTSLGEEKALNYLVEFKYFVDGKTRALNTLTELYPTQKLMNFYSSEQVGKMITEGDNAGKTPVTVRFMVDEKTYKELGQTTFNNAISPDKSNAKWRKLPEKLQEDLNTMRNVRAQCCKEKYVPNSGKITKIPLNIYKSKGYAKEKISGAGKHQKIFLVGDSAFGVPYFRALNNGMLSGSMLARIICNKKITGKMNHYTKFMDKLVKSEFKVAKMKKMGVQAMDKVIHALGKLPLQLLSWDKKEAAALKLDHSGIKRPAKTPQVETLQLPNKSPGSQQL